MPLPAALISFLEKNPLLVVDAGARGGLKGWQNLARWMNVHAFEPDAEEATLLSKNKSAFHSYSVHAKALSSKTEKRKFFLARQRSMSSFLPFDREEFLRHFGRMQEAQQWAAGFETEKTIEVDCTSLDLLFPSEQIDLLKLDTQGTEAEILAGAGKLLNEKRILCLEVEVNLQPVYKGQPAFPLIDQLLRENGFLLVDYRVNAAAFSAVPKPAAKFENPRAASGGDAVYVLNAALLPENEREKAALKAALLLAHRGYLSMAEYLLKTFTQNDSKTITGIFETLNNPGAKAKRKNSARRWLPPVLIDWLK